MVPPTAACQVPRMTEKVRSFLFNLTFVETARIFEHKVTVQLKADCRTFERARLLGFPLTPIKKGS